MKTASTTSDTPEAFSASYTGPSITDAYVNESQRSDSFETIQQALSTDVLSAVSDSEDDDRSSAGEEAEGKDDEKDEIIPADAINAIASEGEKLLNDMWSAAMVYPPSFDQFLTNMDQNRAPHLVCYDHNRVILKDAYGDTTYYNASHVDGFTGKPPYIFAQAPFNKTTETNYWRLVLQEQPQIMLVFGTIDDKQRRGDEERYDISQKNFEKVFCNEFGGSNFEEAEKRIHINRTFWPVNMSDQMSFAKKDVISVTNTGMYKERHMNVYNLTVAEARTKPHSTMLIHFNDWLNDDPMPEYLSDMRALIKIHITRATKKPSAFMGPILLVCPTGSARCATFATLDIVLHRLTEEHTVGIKETMGAIKAQRYGCFRNLEHYKMIREMVMRFAISSGVVHDNAIGEKPESVRKPKKKDKKKKKFSLGMKKKMGK